MNQVASQSTQVEATVVKNSNFDEHVVNEKGLGNAGKGTGRVSTQTGIVVYSPNVS
ncbi:hypothetical protein GASC598I20_007140 [Gilliamella apicola SCGC AB-598-I20]|nr:hypothetical protein GASC598I20_007140 [Gilliamella apicola SCGC AB-598-I20]